ncbi:MAG: hypothetical protein ACFFCW_07650 [Candidatus Hodarchaeota archaeon]
MIKGMEKHTNLPICLTFIGDSITLAYFANLIFSRVSEKRLVRRISIWRLPSIENDKSLSADMILVRTGKFLSNYLRRKRYFAMPEWPDSVLKIDQSEALHQNLSKNTKEYLRKLRKKIKDFEVTIEESHSLEMLETFYYRFYVPFITERQGSLAEIQSLSFLKKVFLRGGLLFIKDRSSHIAGVLFLKKPIRLFHFFRWGVSNTANNTQKKWAGGMLHLLAIEWAKENGYREFNFGGSRPFLNDPILQYKRKWGTELRENTTQRMVIGLKFLCFKESTFSFLTNNPFIFKHKKDFVGVVPFTQDDTVSESFELIKKEYNMPGLRGLLVLYRGKLAGYEFDSLKKEENTEFYPFSKHLYGTDFLKPKFPGRLPHVEGATRTC